MSKWEHRDSEGLTTFLISDESTGRPCKWERRELLPFCSPMPCCVLFGAGPCDSRVLCVCQVSVHANKQMWGQWKNSPNLLASWRLQHWSKPWCLIQYRNWEEGCWSSAKFVQTPDPTNCLLCPVAKEVRFHFSGVPGHEPQSLWSEPHAHVRTWLWRACLFQVYVQNLEVSHSPPEPGTTAPTTLVITWHTAVLREEVVGLSPVREMEPGHGNLAVLVSGFVCVCVCVFVCVCVCVWRVCVWGVCANMWCMCVWRVCVCGTRVGTSVLPVYFYVCALCECLRVHVFFLAASVIRGRSQWKRLLSQKTGLFCL